VHVQTAPGDSGAGTNFKVGEGTRPAPLHFFDSTSTNSRFGERFRGGQYSLVSFLFAVFLLTVLPPCPAICKSGGTCSPRAIWSRRRYLADQC